MSNRHNQDVFWPAAKQRGFDCDVNSNRPGGLFIAVRVVSAAAGEPARSRVWGCIVIDESIRSENQNEVRGP